MKPSVNRISKVPLTALVCCPQCYRLLSYQTDETRVTCHGCGALVKGQGISSSDPLPSLK